MNNPVDPVLYRAHSGADTDERFPSGIFHKLFLPQGLYEALPAVYIVVGLLLILGAVYIGIGHAPMVGYLTVGVSCTLAGVAVAILRRMQRSGGEGALA